MRLTLKHTKEIKKAGQTIGNATNTLSDILKRAREKDKEKTMTEEGR